MQTSYFDQSVSIAYIQGRCMCGWVGGWGGEGVEGYRGVEGGSRNVSTLKEMCLLIFFIRSLVVIFSHIFFWRGVIQIK